MPDLSATPGLEMRDGEPVFREPWQAQAFAMTVALHEANHFDWSEWAEMLGLALETQDNYWQAWMVALEMMALRKGLIGGKDMAARSLAWREAADRTPHGRPITLEGST